MAKGGAGGVEVGRVSIRVVPNFDKFHKRMRTLYKQYKNKPLKVKVKVNSTELEGLTSGLAKQAKVDSNKAGKAIVNELTKVGKGASKKLSKELELDPEALTGNRNRLVRRLRSDLERVLSKMEFNIGLTAGGDDATARLALDRQEKRLKKMLSEITPELDTEDFLQKARKLEAELDNLSTDAVNLDPRKRYEQRLDDFLAAEKKYTALQQKEAGRRFDLLLSKAQNVKEYFAKITPTPDKIDNRVWVKQYKESLAGLKDQLKLRVPVSFEEKTDIDKLYTRIEMLEKSLEVEIPVDFNIKQTAIAKLAAEMKLIESIMGNITKKVETKPALSLNKFLPKFGTGFNPAAWATILGGILLVAAPLIGLITSAMLTLPGLIATVVAPIGAIALGFDGIKKAAENAGLTKDGGLGDVFVKLREEVASVFEGKLTDPFKKLAESVPSFTDSLKGVAAGTSDVMSGLIDTITGSDGAQKIKETLSAIGTELSRSMAPGIADFTQALINLAHQFTTGGALEGLGDWFRDTMADFKEWTSTENLTDSFMALGSALRIVLDTIGEMGKQGLDFVGDPAKMDGFLETLEGIGTLLEDIVEISGQLGDIWDTIVPAFNFGQALTSLMQGNGSEAKRNFMEGWDRIGSGKEMGFKLSYDVAAGLNAGFELGSPFAGLTEAGAEELNQFAYNIAQAGADGMERLEKAITTGDVELGIATQIQGKVGAAVTGAQQALAPLKEGLQTDINAALQPLGDIAGKIGTAFGDVPEKVRGALSQVPGIVTETLSGVGPAADAAMLLLNNSIVVGSAIALLTAETQAPLIVQPFENMATGMAEVGAAMMTGLGAGIRDNVHIAKAAAEQAAIEVKEAAKAAIRSNSPSKDFMDIGRDTQTGLAIGINDNAKGPISAIREVMQAIKDVFGSAEGINLNFYMGESKSAMSSMATSSKEFRSNMSGAVADMGTASTVESGLVEADLADVKRKKAEIDLQIAQLQAQKNATADKAVKAGLTAEIDQLRIQKERLDLLKEENGLQEERKTAIQQLSDTIATNIVDMMKMPGEFAKTTANAAMQDLGISGSGALPTIANWAMDAGTNFIFNVNNMDDAIAGQQAQQHKQAAGIAGGR